ncbi:MAG: DUF3617 family protein [Pseudomonadota bacterium]
MRALVICLFALATVGTAPSSDAPVYRAGGEWEISYAHELVGFDGFAGEVIEQQLAEDLQTERVCEVELRADEYPKAGDPFKGQNRPNCRYTAIEAFGEPVQRTAICDAPNDEPVKLSMSGTVSKEAYEITTSSSLGDATISITERGKLVGPC